MKILWNNYLTDSTVTASSEDPLYTVENLTDIFLERKFQALTAQSLVTVTFPEDRPVSMIAFGFNNVQAGSGRVLVNTYNAVDVLVNTLGAETVLNNTLSAGYVLKSSSGAVLGSGPLTVNEEDDVSITYLSQAVSCRSVEILFSSQGTLYVGGLAVGDPLIYQYFAANPQFADILRDDVVKTKGGQIIGTQAPMLRQWRVVVPDMDNAKRKETRAMLRYLGQYRPVFVDLYEDSDEEPPMYGNFIQAGEYSKDSENRIYDMVMTLEEAR